MDVKEELEIKQDSTKEYLGKLQYKVTKVTHLRSSKPGNKIVWFADVPKAIWSNLVSKCFLNVNQSGSLDSFN